MKKNDSLKGKKYIRKKNEFYQKRCWKFKKITLKSDIISHYRVF